MSELFYKLLILRTPGVGPVRYGALIEKYSGDVRAAVESLGAGSEFIDSIHREIDCADKLGVKYISDDDDLYPDSLRQIKNHPPVLTARGNLETLRRPMVAMVGTRHATAAGMNFMSNLAREFAARGIAVVSGMAAGTDAATHAGALRADGNAQTVAVLAGGVDYVWPIENESLYNDILSRGVVLSEMPVGFVPNATNFIQRNRWVAGLGNTLILGEADMKSGSMTTARFAKQFGRELYAIPSHPSDSRAAGPNSLIASGDAKLCSGISDFFRDDAAQHVKKKNSACDDSLLDKIGTIPVSESVLSEVAQKDISEIKRDLVLLELQGLIRKTDGGYVRV